MLDALRSGAIGVLRAAAVVILALVAAVNLAGFAFLAFAWFIDLPVRVKGGEPMLLFGAASIVCCFGGISRLRLGRAIAAR